MKKIHSHNHDLVIDYERTYGNDWSIIMDFKEVV